ncbi:MAG: hypothetical protein OIN87_04630 [Candidatus Methanoperedens sp.]|nr:hypothetical protein [Candidatus Methanoperedens sp.]
MARKSDIFGSNPFPKFYRDTDKAFGRSTTTKSTRSNNSGYSRPRNFFGNNRSNNSRLDVVIHDPYEDRIREQRNQEYNLMFIKLLLIGGALYAIYYVLNQIWISILSPIIIFIISIKYYFVLGIYLIGMVMVTMYLEKRNINRPYSLLGGIFTSGILALTIMSFFGLI